MVQTQELPSPSGVCNTTKEVDTIVVTSTCFYCACRDVKTNGYECKSLCSRGLISSSCFGTKNTIISYQIRVYDTNCTCSRSFCGIPDVVNLQVKYGQNISLNCSAEPFWNLNNKAIYLRKNKYYASDSNLNIYKMTPSDSGIYSCGTEKMYSIKVAELSINPLVITTKDASKKHLTATHIVIITIFGSIFVAVIILIVTTIVQMKYRRKTINRCAKESDRYAENDDQFHTEVENIYDEIAEVNQGEEILPRDINVYEYPDMKNLHERYIFMKPQVLIPEEC